MVHRVRKSKKNKSVEGRRGGRCGTHPVRRANVAVGVAPGEEDVGSVQLCRCELKAGVFRQRRMERRPVRKGPHGVAFHSVEGSGFVGSVRVQGSLVLCRELGGLVGAEVVLEDEEPEHLEVAELLCGERRGHGVGGVGHGPGSYAVSDRQAVSYAVSSGRQGQDCAIACHYTLITASLWYEDVRMTQ